MAFATGNDQKFWCKAESSYDTAIAIAATDAVALTKLDIQPNQDWNELKEHVGTATLQGEVESRRGGKWTAEAYLTKTNAAGTAPDIGVDLLKTAFGSETVSGGTSVTYAFVDTTPGSLTFTKYGGSILYEIIRGAWAEEIKMEFDGNNEAMISISGGFATYGWVTGAPVLNAGVVTGATTFVLTAATAMTVGVGALVALGADDNSGAGYRVTAVATDGVTYTFTPGLAGAGVSGGVAVTPVVPSQTLTGTVRSGVASGFTLGGTSLNLIKGTVTVKTGVKGIDGEATTDRPRALIRGQRRVEVDLNANFETGWAPYLGQAWLGNTFAFVLRNGPNTAGQRAKINIPKLRPVVTPVEFPESEEATVSIKGKARQSAAAADELTLVYD